MTADEKMELVNSPPRTVVNAAGQLGVSRGMVYKLIDDGALAYMRVGKSAIRIPQAAIDQYKAKAMVCGAA